MHPLEHKALVAFGSDLGESLEVKGAAQVHTELARLAWNIGSCVPGVGERIERLIGKLSDFSIPALLTPGSRLDSAQATFAQVAHTVADPRRLALGAQRHVVEH